MLLDFITFRWETGDGAAGAVDEGNFAAAPPRAILAPHTQTGRESPQGKFCESNTKLGKGLITYDMTPIVSCPGSVNAICREVRPDGKADPKSICWACRKRYRETKKKERLAANFAFSRSDQFVAWAIDKISRARTMKAVRLPGTGDMYSAAFVRKVRAVVQVNPKMRFWLYTRSWAVPKIWAELKNLKGEPNLTVWLSWDRKMAEHYGPPSDRGLPWCWLAENDDDLPVEPVDLVWRNDGHLQWNQSLPEKHILGGSVVCPHEDGVTETTCATCGICWKGEKFRTAKIARLLDKYKD